MNSSIPTSRYRPTRSWKASLESKGVSGMNGHASKERVISPRIADYLHAVLLEHLVALARSFEGLLDRHIRASQGVLGVGVPRGYLQRFRPQRRDSKWRTRFLPRPTRRWSST